MRAAIVQNGLVTNVVEVADLESWTPESGELVEVSDETRVSPGWTWDGSTFTAPDPAPITRNQVDRERDRRIAQGVRVTTSVAGTFPVQSRTRDRDNITALSLAAKLRADESDTTSFTFRDANNTDQTLTPSEMIEVGEQVMKHVNDHYKASWVLKDADPIPTDYIDDKHWP